MLRLIKALATEGWMTSEELYWLAFQASTKSHILEVGSWMGRSTRALADNTSGVVYAVDTWRGSKETEDLLKGKTDDWLLARFTENLSDHIGTDTVRRVRLPSIPAADYFADQLRRGQRPVFDMVFIDGAHDYESVKADILAWRPLLAPGGLLCGHDWGSEGVKQALDEVAPDARRVCDMGSIWADACRGAGYPS